MKNYYQILGLPKGASKAQIKQAYRKLALKYHPDVNKDLNAKDHFVEITEAYQVLTEGRKVSFNPIKSENDLRRESILKARNKARADMRKKYSEFKRKQEQIENEQFKVALYIFIGIIISLIIANFSVDIYRTQMAHTNSDTTVCKVIAIEHHSFKAIFTVGLKDYVVEERASRAFVSLYYENGMPLATNQEFMVIYNKFDPEYASIEGFNFTQNTLLSYFELTTPKIKEWLESENRYVEGAEFCIFEKVYKTFGVEGLAQMYYYNEAIVENLKNNSITFSSFKKQNDFKVLQQQCGLSWVE